MDSTPEHTSLWTTLLEDVQHPSLLEALERLAASAEPEAACLDLAGQGQRKPRCASGCRS